MNDLTAFGWNDDFAHEWSAMDTAGLQPARVVADFGTSLKIATPEILTAELTGAMAHYSNRENIPKVGDWVAVRVSDNGHAVIEQIVPRQSEIARKAAGNRTVKQVIAANVDVAFVLLALDNDFSVERLKRFLYQLSISNIKPIVVLNKADKTTDIESYIEQLQTLQLPIIVTTAITGAGVDKVRECIPAGHTAVLLGSSGVGKSTLTNQLLGRDIQATQAVRYSDATGKHTTVHRELFVLPNGGLLVDMPGIRELQLWGLPDDLDKNFDDIILLASRCKYSTCRHGDEEGCAIRAALQDGTLDAAHYASYLKMKNELVGLKARNTVKMQRGNKKSSKSLGRQMRDTLNDQQDEL